MTKEKTKETDCGGGILTCECGERLPTHLLGIMTSFEHVCSCNRAYKEKDGKFVPNGTQANPFAEYDRAMGLDSTRD